MSKNAELIAAGSAVLGIEFGSTRIKAVLIDGDTRPIAQGSYDWENSFTDGYWTYPESQIREGLCACYADLKKNVRDEYGVTITSLKAIGISAMMHGYMAFDAEDNLLVPFRTWRNTTTGPAADALTDLFGYHIPQRWSIAHLYQAILNKEPHVKDIRSFNTLAGYVHFLLSGVKVLGVGDASGMFPIDPKTGSYSERMLDAFEVLITGQNFPWKIREILPGCVRAGEDAGTLTEAGALLLDPSGDLKGGALMCPPEGDAGTGMAATNSVRVRTGNVSAGTSVFSMIVLEKPLSKPYPELDLVTTPSGDEVAMVHCNNCTSDLNAWVGVFGEALSAFGVSVDRDALYGTLYREAMKGDKDCGGVIANNFFSGEPVAGVGDQAGVPFIARGAEAKLSLANLMRANICSAFATLKIGNDLLMKEEHVEVDSLMGHGGIFRTKGVAQNLLAAAMNAPVTVMETAGEGGAWGIALLAAYRAECAAGASAELADWLDTRVFADSVGETVKPDPEDVEGFAAYTAKFVSTLPAEHEFIGAVY